MLAPTWAQLKIGHIVRRERDHRFYHNLFSHHPKDVRGLKRTLLRLIASEVAEPPSLESPVAGAGMVVVRFEGLADWFAPLTGWHEHLHQQLRVITRHQWLDAVDQFREIPIGIHVRCGDFTRATNVDDLLKKGTIRTPVAWFAACLQTIRETVGGSVSAYVVSDGLPAELNQLLTIPNVTLVQTGSAISDLLLLAKARLLLASGSSFSAWASFLGQMPTVSHPGQSLVWFKLQDGKNRYVGEFDPKSPPVPFLDQARAALANDGHPASGLFTRLEGSYEYGSQHERLC